MHKEEFPCCQKSSTVSDSGIISYWLAKKKKRALITLLWCFLCSLDEYSLSANTMFNSSNLFSVSHRKDWRQGAGIKFLQPTLPASSEFLSSFCPFSVRSQPQGHTNVVLVLSPISTALKACLTLRKFHHKDPDPTFLNCSERMHRQPQTGQRINTGEEYLSIIAIQV